MATTKIQELAQSLAADTSVQDKLQRLAASGTASLDPALFRLTIIAAVVLILLYMLSGHIIEQYKILVLHESTVGLLTGVFVQWLLLDTYVVKFDQQSFFFFLLPPIVFASAYTLKKKNFVRNISYILGLGVLGTVVAMTVLSCILLWANDKYRDPTTGETWVQPAECLLLSSVLASTDTVAVLTLITPDKFQVLNAVLFGEGVVNDAVTILLYQAVDRQIRKQETTHDHSKGVSNKNVSIGSAQVLSMVVDFFSLSGKSACMGAAIGLFAAYLLKKFDLNYDPVKECTVLLMMAYLSYLCAEASGLSGIISMFSCGLFLAHYAYWNVSKATRQGSEMLVNSASGMCQSFLYIYIGLSAFSINRQFVKVDMVVVTIIAVLICRLFSVGVPILIIYLWSGCKPLTLRWNEWVFVYFGGLIRGAICFGLAIQMTSDNHRVLKNTVQIIAIVTIVGVGAPLQLIARCFSIKTDQVVKDEKAAAKLERREQRKKAQVTRMLEEQKAGDNDYHHLQAPADMDAEKANEQDSESGHSHQCPDVSGAENEDEQIDAIQHEFQHLIDEGTYPWIIQKFKDFDSEYMFPIFKREATNLTSSIGNAENAGEANVDDFKAINEGDEM